jgi:hypothetical protein
LGSCYVTSFTPVVTLSLLLCSLLVWRIGIWGDRNGTVFGGF